MTGKITQLHPLTPKDVTPRQVVSYDISTLFGLPTLERFNPDLLASRKGLRIYAQMMEDEQVKAVMTFRLSSIISRGWEFKYADDSELGEDERARRIKLYQQAVRDLRGSFNDALMAVLRGHIFGFSVVEKVYDSVMFEGRPASGIVELLYRDPTWFRFFTDKYGTLMRCEQWISNEKIEVDLKKFIHYVRAPAEDRYYGQSELRAAYRAWYMKDVVLKLYGRYLERFAGGFAYAELPDDSALGTGNPEYVKLQDALTDMSNLASLILPPGVKLTVFQPSNSGEYREALTYLDLAIAKSVLVPNLLGLSHTGQTGAFAQSQTQLEAYFMTTASDAARLEDTLNEQFFNDLGDLNFGDGQYPRFRFKPASVEHVKWIVKQWQELTGAGVVMTTEADENHLRELLEMPARTEEDSLIAEEKQELDLQGKEAEAKFAPKPAPKAFTLEDLRAELDVRDAKLMASIQPSITLNTGLPPGPDGSTGPSSRDRTGAAAVRFHTPGGHEHDQSTHGRKGGGTRELRGKGRGKGVEEHRVHQIAEELGVQDLQVRNLGAKKLDMINGRPAMTLGQYDPNTDTIFINRAALEHLTENQLRGVLLHEESHRYFQKAKGYSDRGKTAEFLRDNFGKLTKEDGTTAYAKQFWKQQRIFGEGAPELWERRVAIDESLAEQRRKGQYTPTFAKLSKLIGSS